MQRRIHARRHLDAECWFQLNSPLEESLINFLRSGPHLLNETTGEPVANEAPIWKSSKQYVREPKETKRKKLSLDPLRHRADRMT